MWAILIMGRASYHQHAADVLAIRPWGPFNWTADRDYHDVRLVSTDDDGRQHDTARPVRDGRSTSKLRKGERLAFTVNGE